MSKYYTPELEEFHVGFEYEALVDYYKQEFEKFTIDDTDSLRSICSTWDRGEVEYWRVKYLDIEDIDSLGWKFEEECPAWISFNMSGEKNLTLYKESKKVEILIPDNPLQYHYSFAGTIKNKSELKKLLKQLGI